GAVPAADPAARRHRPRGRPGGGAADGVRTGAGRGRRSAPADPGGRAGRAAAAESLGRRLAPAPQEQARRCRLDDRDPLYRARHLRPAHRPLRPVRGGRSQAGPDRSELDLAVWPRPQRPRHLQPDPLWRPGLPGCRCPLPGHRPPDRGSDRRPRWLPRRRGRQHLDARRRRHLRHPPVAARAALRQLVGIRTDEHLSRARARRLGDHRAARAGPVPGPAGAGVRQRRAGQRGQGLQHHPPPHLAEQPDADHRRPHLRHPDGDLHRGGALLRRRRDHAAAAELGEHGRRRQQGRLHPERPPHAALPGARDRPDDARLHLHGRWPAGRPRSEGERL
ncbi:MAG: Dipeptide transport system permease protein DppC, partial [uncultured Thermomicrobiales bacterium]